MLEKIKDDERIRKEKRKELEELRQHKIKIKREDEKRKQIETQKVALVHYKLKYGDFWKHPEFENCYIPIEIKHVPSKDKVNRIDIWIEENGEYSTHMTLVARVGGSNLTKEEYFEKYCIKGDCDEKGNLKYYFVGDNINLMDIKNIKVKFKSIWKYMLNHINGGFNNDDIVSCDSDDSDDSNINIDDYVYC
jgi:hypothetical protein